MEREKGKDSRIWPGKRSRERRKMGEKRERIWGA